MRSRRSETRPAPGHEHHPVRVTGALRSKRADRVLASRTWGPFPSSRAALPRRNPALRHWWDARAPDPRRRLRGRPRLPLRLHAGVVAALEGPVRGGRRPRRHARTAAGRSSRRGGAPRRTRPTSRASRSPAARDAVARLKGDRYLRRAEDNPDGRARRPRDARGDLALGDAALAAAPRAARRARAARRGRRLHRADGAPPRHPDGAARALRHPGRLLRRRRADEPARVRRHGHRLQLVPRRRSVRVRPRCSRTPRAGSSACASSARGAPRPSSGAPTPSSSRRSRSTRRSTSSSTATATSSAATGWRRWSASRRGALPGRRLRARRARLPGRHRPRAADRRRAVQRVRRARSPRRGSTSASRAARTRPSTRRRRAARSSSPSAGAAIVSNPYDGIERWFEPGSRAARRRRRRRGDRRLPRRCSTTRRRPRSWAAARASACSTSTPTATARAGCSTLLGAA